MRDLLTRTLRGPFLKFAVVGGGGTVTNLAIYYILADRLGWHFLMTSVIAFCVAMTQNYLFNSLWTFAERLRGEGTFRYSITRHSLYAASSLAGLGVNLVTLYLLERFKVFPLKTLSQAVGVLFGMAFNYTLSKRIVFK